MDERSAENGSVQAITSTKLPRTSVTDGQEKLANQSKSPFARCGIIFGLLAAIFSGTNALLAKMVEIHAVEITLFRLCVQFVIILPIMFYKRETVDILGPENLRIPLWLRGFAGSTNLIFLYLAVTSLPLGDAVTITYLSLVLIPFGSKIVLKESLTVMDMVFAIISLTGVVLIARPSFFFPSENEDQSSTNTMGVIYALISSVMRVASVVTLRMVGPSTYPFLNMIYYCACGIVTSSVILSAIQVFEYPCQRSLPFLCTMGVLGVLGQFFLTMSSKTERAGTVAILKASQIIFVYAMQVIILQDIPNPLSLAGAALVLSSSVGIGIRKFFTGKKKSKNK